MNKRVIINPGSIIDLDFKSIGTYKLYLYILKHYDEEIRKVKLDINEIMKEIYLSKPTIRKSIDELLYNNVIEKLVNYKHWFKVNKSNYYGKRKSNNE